MSSPKAVGRKHYGKVPVQVSGRERWETQNHTQSWSDDGDVRKIIEPAIAALEQVVAKNAALGASEYLGSAESTLVLAPDNDILVGVRIANDEAALIAYVPLKKLLMAALSELRPTLGVDPNAQALLSQLITLGSQLASLGRPNPNSQPTAQG
jgi:hypothetical protein